MSNPENSIGAASKFMIIVVMMCLYSLQSLLITASKSDGKGYSYDPNCVVLITELTKAVIAGGLLLQARADSKPGAVKVTVDSNCFKYAIPALLYAVHNNLVFLGLIYLDAPTYQLLNNVKIIGTGLLYRAVLKKPLRMLQWIGLAVLMFGQMVATLSTGAESTRPEGFVTGVMVMILLAAMSGMAGVYNELLLKASTDSTHWQNLQLYIFSVFFCTIQYFFKSASGVSGTTSGGFFQGFEYMTWAVIFCSAFMGQAVSFVLKYTNNITNRFATAASLLLTTLGSWVLFGTVVETPFYLGVGLIGLAFSLYFVDHEKLILYDSELLSDKPSAISDPNEP